MRYHVLACDYDGTLASHGKVNDATLTGLERFLASGRRLVMVTGRELPDLQNTFSRLDLFEWIVAENGALLYHPATRQVKALGPAPPEAFLNALKQRGVAPVSTGRVIVATLEPHENTVLEVIHALGLELHVVFNKGAVMVLPAGISKASGLAAALARMKLSPHNVVGVGDAENDHAFLHFCECSAAVANALPALKEGVDLVTAGDHGAGVVELIDELIRDDLRRLDGRLLRHHIPLGTAGDEEVGLPPYDPVVLVAGPSASGKSTVTTGLLERLIAEKYQVCVVDPEGDYESFEGAFVLGGADRPPALEEGLRLLDNPDQSAIISLTGMSLGDRPQFFLELLARLLQMRARTGRPHWLILDEAHHLMPAAWQPPAGLLPEEFGSVLLVTVHPDMLSVDVLQHVDTVVAVGKEAENTLRTFANLTDTDLPAFSAPELEQGEVLLWSPAAGAPRHVRVMPCRSDRRRHRRKYAEGTLPPDRSFYFQGPEGKLNLRAQNLMLFLQLAEGVDDATWEYHLRRHDVSRWFREGIKDDDLASEAERIERLLNLSAAASRELIKAAIERDYTLPAEAPAADHAGGMPIA
jgi:hydroxymethylpyrimidine pyrophosphatase-like HAD family hydrolase